MYTLLVIDMQPGFLSRFDDFCNYEVKEEIIRGCQKAVMKAIADGAEILDVNFVWEIEDYGPTIPEIADLWKTYAALFKGRVSLVEKHGDDGAAEIIGHGIAEKTIRVCGINAGACVEATVTSLVDEGQEVYVIADAVANSWSNSCEGDLALLEANSHGLI